LGSNVGIRSNPDLTKKRKGGLESAKKKGGELKNPAVEKKGPKQTVRQGELSKIFDG